LLLLSLLQLLLLSPLSFPLPFLVVIPKESAASFAVAVAVAPGPKARPISAWGIAPGTKSPETQALKARPIGAAGSSSVPAKTIFREKWAKLACQALRVFKISITHPLSAT
jgi:hypothetical protein